MYVKRKYGFWMTFNWSKKPFIYGTLYGGIICIISWFINMHIAIPWGPVGVMGIAVAFYLGFKNNSSYDRTWEARKIWGSIVNNSRTFGAATVSFVSGTNAAEVKKELIYRHIAWLTALRHQLRISKEWEHVELRERGRYAPKISEDFHNKLDGELVKYLSQEEVMTLKSRSNIAVQILRNQSKRLQELRDKNYYEDFRHMEFHQLITTFYADQGKSERIKNFPFPRQYASAALWITFVFCAFIPFGLFDIIKDRELWMIWLVPFLSGLLIWIFFLMEKIGDHSENPFEGGYNDIPITSISRTIEIDMREMVEDENIPKAIGDDNGVLM